MHYLITIFWLLTALAATAQLPRNGQDRYEYTQQLTVSAPDTLLEQRAKAFFLTPFIVHWDSVAFVEGVHTARGHIVLRITQGLAGFNVPVSLTMELAIATGGYRYSIRSLEADKKDSKYLFPLEQRPPTVKAATYEQLLQKTHQYMGSVISLLKRQMNGEL